MIKLLRESLKILKDKELQQLVDEFREIDADFRSLGVMAERDALMEGAPRKRDTFDPTRAKNDELLDKAAGIQSDNLSKLKGGLQTIENTRETGKLTAAKLEEDREKLKRIDQQLDEVQVSIYYKVYSKANIKNVTSPGPKKNPKLDPEFFFLLFHFFGSLG